MCVFRRSSVSPLGEFVEDLTCLESAACAAHPHVVFLTLTALDTCTGFWKGPGTHDFLYSDPPCPAVAEGCPQPNLDLYPGHEA